MLPVRTALNALNLYLALHLAHTPMTRFSEFLTALNPATRKPLRFYFLTLWAWFSLASAVVSILLPLVHASDRLSLALAVLIQVLWLFYAVAVLSWRLSGYLYQKACQALRWLQENAQNVAQERFSKIVRKQEEE
jgi:hypothetical protein